jgi:hypothetical protein
MSSIVPPPTHTNIFVIGTAVINTHRITSLEWPSIFTELKLEADYTSFDLMDAYLGRVLSILKQEDPDASNYGFLTRTRAVQLCRSQ